MKKYIRPLLEKPERAKEQFRYRDMGFLWSFMRPVWKTGLASVLLTVLATALSSLLPLGTKVLIDFVVLGKSAPGLERWMGMVGLGGAVPAVMEALQSVGVLVAAMLAVGITVGLVQAAQRFVNLRFEQEVTFNLQTTLFERMLRFPLSFFKGGQTGYLVARATDDVEVLHWFFTQSGVQLLTNLFSVLFGAFIIFTLSVKLALLSVALLPVYVLISAWFAGRQRSVGRAARERRAEAARDMQEVFAGVETVKSHGGEAREVRKVSGRLRSLLQTKVLGEVLSAASNSMVRGAQFVTTLVIMWFGAGEIRRGAMTIGDYVAFTTYVVYLSGSVRNLSLFHLMLQPAFASLDRLMELFRAAPELPGEDGKGSGIVPEEVKGEIRLEGVHFEYVKGKPVLRGVDAVVAPGETVALAGASGAGKTTVANLLLKFYRPGEGRILLDGREYGALDTRWLRGRIGIVSQDIFLFDDTVANNIRYGRPGATDVEVERAAGLARIAEEIGKFPGGYKTMVGERGVVLSAGQRQRVSIARAFLREPAILILDEPTSALDAVTEGLIRDSLADLTRGRTTFIISHREAMLAAADRVLTLHNGKLVTR